MVSKRYFYLYFLLIYLAASFYPVSAVLISDQGADVKNSTDQLLTLGNLTIDIYDASSGGNVVYTQTILNAIVNGSWNMMINPNLEYGKSYWKDYEINGFDLNFSGNDTLEFKSPLGIINASFVNFSLISNIDVIGNISIGGNLTVRGNTTIAGNLTVTGNVTAAYFRGDGSGLTGITATEVDAALASNLSNGFSSDVKPRTDITQSLGTATARWFQGWIKNLFTENVTVNGNLTVIGNTTLEGNLNATGNVTARYFLGDGSKLFNVNATATETDPSLASNLTNGFTSSLNPFADITQSLGSVTKRWFSGWIKNIFAENVTINGNLTVIGNTTITSSLNVSGNVTAGYFFGDGSKLFNVNSTVTETDPALASNLTNGFSSSVNPLADITQSLGSVTKRWFMVWGKNSFVTNETVIGNLTVFGNATIIGNLTVTQNTTLLADLNVSGNVTARYFVGNGAGLTGVTATEVDPSLASNLTNGFSSSVNPLADITQSLGSTTKRWFVAWTKNSFVTNETVTGNLTVFGNATIIGNLTVTQNTTLLSSLNVSGNVTARYFVGDGSGLTGVTATEVDPALFSNLSNGFSSSLNPLTDIVQSLGSVTKRWFSVWGKNSFVTNETVIGNLTVFGNATIIGNLTVTQNTTLLADLNASGNVTARYFYGNISNAKFPASACSGTDKVTALGSDGTVTCAADQTGGAGTQTRWANQTMTAVSQSAAVWKELFQLGIAAGKNYTFDCHFTVFAGATTNGVQFNINLTGGNITYWEGGYEHPTAATATAFVRCSGNLSFCQSPSGTSTTTGLPVWSWGRLINTKAGHLNISVRGELGTSATTVEKGAYCILEDIAGGVVS